MQRASAQSLLLLASRPARALNRFAIGVLVSGVSVEADICFAFCEVGCVLLVEVILPRLTEDFP